MAPVLREMEMRGMSYRLFLTGQHSETIADLLQEFGIRTSAVYLYQGKEINSIVAMLPWFLRAAWRMWALRNEWGSKKAVVVVHGDTFSTLLGALVGRLAGAKVAHVESGLRSFNVVHPFPEEITRLVVFRLGHYGYCPGLWACSNLSRYPIKSVNTGTNTLSDALRLALASGRAAGDLPEKPYAVVSIHRFENLYKKDRITRIVSLVEELAAQLRVVFVLHPATRKRLDDLGALARLENNQSVELRPRMTYVPFVALAASARFVITDGGSNQEELSYLGVPTLLMRKATERQEGLGKNVVLSRYSEARIAEFLAVALSDERETSPEPQTTESSPSAVIVDHLHNVVRAGLEDS